jgi:hypothetical protein
MFPSAQPALPSIDALEAWEIEEILAAMPRGRVAMERDRNTFTVGKPVCPVNSICGRVTLKAQIAAIGRYITV